jgi:hypothetical protein
MNLNNKDDYNGPNIVVEWIALLLCIPKAEGSNLDPKTRSPD